VLEVVLVLAPVPVEGTVWVLVTLCEPVPVSVLVPVEPPPVPPSGLQAVNKAPAIKTVNHFFMQDRAPGSDPPQWGDYPRHRSIKAQSEAR
jgi:hypothetical protein